jgi:hypothetical protein
VLRLGDVAGRDVTVIREVGTASGDRVELRVHVDGRLHTIPEAKVLVALDPKQFARHELAFPDAESHLLLSTRADWSSTRTRTHGGAG